MADRIDKLMEMVQSVVDSHSIVIEEIKILSQRISDLEITLLNTDLPDTNPIKLRLAGKRN